MNKKTFTFILGTLLSFGICSADTLPQNAIIIPQQGNTFVTATPTGGSSFAVATQTIIDTFSGEIKSWNNPETVLSLYINVGRPGDFTLWVDASAGPASTDRSTISFSLGKQTKKLNLKGGQPEYRKIGTFKVTTPGYQKIDIQGIKKTASNYADIIKFAATGSALAGENHFLPEDKLSEVYWTRRGPSVHMAYTPPAENIEYFYNEVTVPEGHDVNGTYFMLTGFAEGYMGIQAIRDEHDNNANLVLFSVWSPFSTDNPDEIPDELHVQQLAHGQGVTVQNFGHEGSGKQSFMHFPWEAGKTYRTLVKVTPDGKGNTIYTGYFGDDQGNWYLLSRLLRPKTDTYYKWMHSFLECFHPATSPQTRSVHFGNQWVRDKDGKWYEVTEGTFSCDNTGRNGLRTDLVGGLVGNHFMLQNCGFINEHTEPGTKFHRTPGGIAPDIDFNKLEQMAK